MLRINSTTKKRIKLILNVKKNILFLLALLYFPFVKKKFNGNIWLIGGHGGSRYDDNSAALHQYIVNNQKGISIFWVINRSSPDFSKVADNYTYIKKDSFKCMLYILAASVLICSHGKGDITGASDWLRHSLLKKKYRVFLSHGVEGLKRNNYKNNMNAYFDFFASSSSFERQIKIDSWQIDEDKVVVTGYARYDGLYSDNGRRKKNSILYMPTWRDWVITDKNNLERFYYQIDKFVCSDELNEFLERKGIILYFHPHINMHNNLRSKKTYQSCSAVKCVANNSVQEYIKEAALLVTDYSSVCWDFLYLKKPVLFYQFDMDEYLAKRGSYLDLRNDLLVETAYDAETAIKKLKNIVLSGYSMINYEKDVNILLNKMFRYRDRSNCHQLFEAIAERAAN